MDHSQIHNNNPDSPANPVSMLDWFVAWSQSNNARTGLQAMGLSLGFAVAIVAVAGALALVLLGNSHMAPVATDGGNVGPSSRLRIVNGCDKPLWIASFAGAMPFVADVQLEGGKSHQLVLSSMPINTPKQSFVA